MKYTIEFTDNNTRATSPIDTVEAPSGYTAYEYIKDCIENADESWCDMLVHGTVAVIPAE